MGSTTYNFAKDDICAWKLKSSGTETFFMMNYNINIENALEVDCYIVYGTSLDNMDKEIPCKNKT